MTTIIKPDVTRTADTNNTVTDANLKVVKSLVIPNGDGFSIDGLQDVDGHIYLRVDPENEAVFIQAYANGIISEFLSAAMLAAIATSGKYTDLVEAPEFADIATSGEYSDLIGTPDLSKYLTSIAWGAVQNKPDFADVALSGKYTDLTERPDLSNYLTSVAWSIITGKPVFSAVATSGEYNDLNNKPDLSVYALASALDSINNAIAAMANQEAFDNIAQRDAYNVAKLPFSAFVSNDGDGKWALYQATSIGVNASYVKLSDPDLLNAAMTNQQIAAAYESNPGVNRFTDELFAKLNNLATVAVTGKYSDLINAPDLSHFLTSVGWSDISNKPIFKTVATTGKYSDLQDIPQPLGSSDEPEFAGAKLNGLVQLGAYNMGVFDFAPYYGSAALGYCLVGQNLSGGSGETDFVHARNAVGSPGADFGGFQWWDLDNAGILTRIMMLNGTTGGLTLPGKFVLGTISPSTDQSLFVVYNPTIKEFETATPAQISNVAGGTNEFMYNSYNDTSDFTWPVITNITMFISGASTIKTVNLPSILDVFDADNSASKRRTITNYGSANIIIHPAEGDTINRKISDESNSDYILTPGSSITIVCLAADVENWFIVAKA